MVNKNQWYFHDLDEFAVNLSTLLVAFILLMSYTSNTMQTTSNYLKGNFL
jgi:hypothetical protein